MILIKNKLIFMCVLFINIDNNAMHLPTLLQLTFSYGFKEKKDVPASITMYVGSCVESTVKPEDAILKLNDIVFDIFPGHVFPHLEAKNFSDLLTYRLVHTTWRKSADQTINKLILNTIKKTGIDFYDINPMSYYSFKENTSLDPFLKFLPWCQGVIDCRSDVVYEMYNDFAPKSYDFDDHNDNIKNASYEDFNDNNYCIKKYYEDNFKTLGFNCSVRRFKDNEGSNKKLLIWHRSKNNQDLQEQIYIDIDALYSPEQLSNYLNTYSNFLINFSISGDFKRINPQQWQNWLSDFKQILKNNNIILKTLYFFPSEYDPTEYVIKYIVPLLNDINCTYISFPIYQFQTIKDYIINLEEPIFKKQLNTLNKLIDHNGFTMLYYVCCTKPTQETTSPNLSRKFIEKNLKFFTQFNVFYKGYINYLFYFIQAHQDHVDYQDFYRFFVLRALKSREVYSGCYYRGCFYDNGNYPSLNFFDNPYFAKCLTQNNKVPVCDDFDFVIDTQENQNIKSEMSLNSFVWKLMHWLEKKDIITSYHKKMKKHLERYPDSPVKNFVENFDKNKLYPY